MKSFTRIMLRVETIEAESIEEVGKGHITMLECLPFVVEDTSFDSGDTAKVNIAILGHIVATAAAAITPKGYK